MKRQWVVVILIAFVFMVISSLPIFVPWITKPPDREYNFLQGYSNDYVIYVSFIKEGMYGRWWTTTRVLPLSRQAATPVHLLYILIGKVAAFLHLSAPLAYHLAQFLFGWAYLLSIYAFFSLFVQNHLKRLVLFLATIFTWTVAWVVPTANGLVYHSLATWYNVSAFLLYRFNSRPHYEFGGFIFLCLMILLIRIKSPTWWSMLLGGLGGFALGLVQAPYALICFFAVGLLIIRVGIGQIWSAETAKRYLPVMVGLGGSLLLSYWSTTKYPWMYVFFALPPLSWSIAWQNILAFGPIFWLGYPGLCLSLGFTPGHSRARFLVWAWITIQLALFFVLHHLINAEPVRFIQSLYYVPLALGVALGIEAMPRPFSRNLFYPVFILLILIGFPTYIYNIHNAQSVNTNRRDYNGYSAFIFPSRAIMEAYRFLDEHTPLESRVMSAFEASQNIQMYSHNFVYGAPQLLSDAQFAAESQQNMALFAGSMSPDAMRKFFSIHDIQYVYIGYQERWSDVFERHPEIFSEVYRNPEVAIVQVHIE